MQRHGLRFVACFLLRVSYYWVFVSVFLLLSFC
jgi:hypothetical protein